MEINRAIREQVIQDLQLAEKYSQNIPITRWFRGLPGVVNVESELPAIAVAVTEGEVAAGNFSAQSWTGILTVRIFVKGDVDIDSTLDSYGEMVREKLDIHYTANRLLTNFNRHSFQYARDEQSPWGTLDLNFTIEYTEEVSE
ncbi:phage tail terminator protein [Photobacterium sp. MCCC 1A19761]|uniref:phage tail terminator protein n=1 Tax=Photobacterium sp. MCCC 1A19761 TaxID=3115000 RepID=UPI00307E1422